MRLMNSWQKGFVIAAALAAQVPNSVNAGTRTCDIGACDRISDNCSVGTSPKLFVEGTPEQIYSEREPIGTATPPTNSTPTPMAEPYSPSPGMAAPMEAAPSFGSSSIGGSAGGGFTGFSFAGSTPGTAFSAAAPGSYIDSAIVANMFRFRFDSAYGNPTPDRAEFFYGQCGLFGGNAPGPLQNETNVDYQELRPYLETALNGRLSMFIEVPIRYINPEVNPNASGLSDLQVGFKRALVQCNGRFLTAQLRVYSPTGSARDGLGTGHVSIEPGLLYLNRRSDRMTTQGEFQVWIPTGDSRASVGNGPAQNFAGTVLRYGIGGGYDLLVADTCCQRRRLTAVVETVGWSVLDGLVLENNLAQPAQTTIVNIKSGLRYTNGNRSIAASYGRAVTADVWYTDILRIEYRYAF